MADEQQATEVKVGDMFLVRNQKGEMQTLRVITDAIGAFEARDAFVVKCAAFTFYGTRLASIQVDEYYTLGCVPEGWTINKVEIGDTIKAFKAAPKPEAEPEPVLVPEAYADDIPY